MNRVAALGGVFAAGVVVGGLSTDIKDRRDPNQGQGQADHG